MFYKWQAKMYCNEKVPIPHLHHHLDLQGVRKCEKQNIINYDEKVPIPYLHDHLDLQGVNGEVCANRQVTIGKVHPQSIPREVRDTSHQT